MKISIAQIEAIKGNIKENILKHQKFITIASTHQSEAIFFPELSLTGYEPQLAKTLASDKDDKRLDALQKLCNEYNIVIGAGLPINTLKGVNIGMIIFTPHCPRHVYSKQQLHADELPYFVEGEKQYIIEVGGEKVAPSICYESLQLTHSKNAKKLGATIYVASVAKSTEGINKANMHYPNIANRFLMPVLMSNCVGFCDNFQSAGCSSVWTKNGKKVAALDSSVEGLLTFDTNSENVISEIA